MQFFVIFLKGEPPLGAVSRYPNHTLLYIMSQVKHYLHKNRRSIIGILGIFALACLLYAGQYFYTGKGWLLLAGKESLAGFYYNRGGYYFNGGAYNLDIAANNFQKALAASSTYPVAHYQLGRINFIHGNFSSALIEMNKELAINPTFWRVHYMKGLIYGYRRQYIQAVEEFKLSIEQEPYPTWAGYNDLSWAYFSQGDYKNAAEAAWEGLQYNPQAPYIGWLQNSYAVAEMNLGNYKTAEKYFLLAQENFARATPAQWGIAYRGNDPQDYEDGLAQARAAIDANLKLVHSKLGDN